MHDSWTTHYDDKRFTLLQHRIIPDNLNVLLQHRIILTNVLLQHRTIPIETNETNGPMVLTRPARATEETSGGWSCCDRWVPVGQRQFRPPQKRRHPWVSAFLWRAELSLAPPRRGVLWRKASVPIATEETSAVLVAGAAAIEDGFVRLSQSGDREQPASTTALHVPSLHRLSVCRARAQPL